MKIIIIWCSFLVGGKVVLFVLFVHLMYTVQKHLVDKYNLVDQYSSCYFADFGYENCHLLNNVVDFLPEFY